MTSKLSSAKQFSTSFTQTLKKYAFHSVLLFALLTPLFFDIVDMVRDREFYLRGLTDYDYLKDYVFALNRYMGGEEMGFCCLVLGLSGMFLALHCWRFLHVKKTVNVYFSLGLSRANLFWSRFLACAVLLIAPVVIVFAVLVGANLFLFGSCAALWTAAVIYALSFIIVALFSFAVTTLAMAVTGASVESFLCAGALIAMPGTVFFGIKYLSVLFLKGAPYERWIMDIVTQETVSNGTFAENAEFLNFFYPVMDNRFSSGFKQFSSDGWSSPGWGYALTYLAAVAVVAAIAFLCFKYRKNENAGFLGKNPALIGVSLLSLSYLLTVFAYFLVEDSVTDAFIIFVALPILFLVYTIIMAVLLRGRKKLLRAMPVAFAICAVFALTCTIFITDSFGYKDRIPDKEDIASVSISSGSYQQASFLDNSYSFYQRYFYYDDADYFNTPEKFAIEQLDYHYSNGADVISGLTEEKDIDTVLNIHRKLMQADDSQYSIFSYPVALQYTLKDGSPLTRYYDGVTPEVMELLRVYEQHEATVDASAGELANQWIEFVTLVAPAASQTTILPQSMVDEGFGGELLSALASDVLDKTLHPVRFGTDAPIGYISLSSNLRLYEQYSYGDGVYYDEDGMMYVEATTAVPLEYYEKYYVFDGEAVTYSLGKICEEFEYFDAYDLYPVYADMKATVALLTQYDLLQYFTSSFVPVRAKLMHTPFTGSETWAEADETGYLMRNRSQYFISNYTSPEYTSYVELCPQGAITNDAAVLEELVKHSFLRYPVTQDGYFAAFEYADGTSVLTYIPAEKVPAELK